MKAAASRRNLKPLQTASHSPAREVLSALESRPAFEVIRGTAGDHPHVSQFLTAVSHRPSAAEFQAQIDAPFYHPQDRLLVKRAGEVIAHVRLTRRELRFGSQSIFAGNLSDFAVLHEYRRRGCGSQLLAAAEQQLRNVGCFLATVRTRHPQYFIKRGWCAGLQPHSAMAHTHEIMAYLCQDGPATVSPLQCPTPPLNIRLWRQVELDALKRLYSGNSAGILGPPVRDDAYWRWLIDRRGYDRIYVAIEGPDRLDLNDPGAPIVGYACMRRGHILEIMAADDSPRVTAELLKRACGDAMERDFHHLRIDAPPGRSVHAILANARDHSLSRDSGSGAAVLASVLDVGEFLQQCGDELHRRARGAGQSLPCELGLRVGNDRYVVAVNRNGTQVREGKPGRSQLVCSRSQFCQLAIGQLDVAAELDARRLIATTNFAREFACAVFPRLPMWNTAWDDSPAK
jgi:predicted N-acetyltransferase YhbS